MTTRYCHFSKRFIFIFVDFLVVVDDVAVAYCGVVWCGYIIYVISTYIIIPCCFALVY